MDRHHQEIRFVHRIQRDPQPLGFKKKPSYHYVADFVGAQDETNFVSCRQDGLICPVLP